LSNLQKQFKHPPEVRAFMAEVQRKQRAKKNIINTATDFGDFPDSRKFEPETENGFFDSSGYIQAISVWYHDLKKELQIERLWCEAKIGNPTSSQVENDYYRGYMQCIDRVLTGIQPTEIKCSMSSG
jgi:hypothetical protein